MSGECHLCKHVNDFSNFRTFDWVFFNRQLGPTHKPPADPFFPVDFFGSGRSKPSRFRQLLVRSWREKQHIGNLQLSSHWTWCLYFAVKRDWENNWKMLKRCLRDAGTAGTAAAEGLEQCQTTPSVHCNVVADLLINAKALVACQNIKKCCGISQKRPLLTPGSSWSLRLRQKLQILLHYQRVKLTLNKSHQKL